MSKTTKFQRFTTNDKCKIPLQLLPGLKKHNKNCFHSLKLSKHFIHDIDINSLLLNVKESSQY